MNLFLRLRIALVAMLCTLVLPSHAQVPPDPAGPATKAPTPDAPSAAAEPTAAAAPNFPAAPDVTNAPAVPSATAAPADSPPPKADAPSERSGPARRRVNHGTPSNFPAGDHVVGRGNRAREAVSIFGTTTVEGTTDSDAFSLLGSTVVTADARVGGSAVAVLGRLHTEGEVRRDAVSVLGGSEINGPVHGNVVAVLGNLVLGPKAAIDGEIVVVGGKLTRDPAAVVHGNQVKVLMGLGGIDDTEWLSTWLRRCVLYLRPLAFGAHLGWAWMIAGAFLAFYVIISLLFPAGVVRCAQTLETRPGSSVLAAMLSVLLTPVTVVLLALTVVGALLVPVLAAGLLMAGLFGKVVMLAWIGRRFTQLGRRDRETHPALAVLIGGAFVLLLYTVPVLGLALFAFLKWLGTGVVLFTLALALKREKRPAAPGGSTGPLPAGVPPTGVPPIVVPPVASAPSAGAGYGMTSPLAGVPAASAGGAAVAYEVPPAPRVSPGFTGESTPQTSEPVPPPPVVEAGATLPPPSFGAAAAATAAGSGGFGAHSNIGHVPASLAVTWPRAGLPVRLGALAIDGVLIGLLLAFLGGLMPAFLRWHAGPGGWLIAVAAYGAVMWKLRGTTVGGIVCGLKVVRVDQRELDWATAIVRALGCFLSLVVAGLGFIWVAIDDDKQSWHDKIAGTMVVRVPKGVSLL